MVAGHSAESFTKMADEVYTQYFKPKLWPETVRLAKAHVEAGREVWLVTASPQEIADVLAHRLGLTGGLGTVVERKDGVLTGKLVGKTLHGKAKRRAVKALAKERHISLKRSYAYSDSSNDLPMLTRVGHPVCVNPDKILTKQLLEYHEIPTADFATFDGVPTPQRAPDLIMTRAPEGWRVDLNRSTLPTVVVKEGEARRQPSAAQGAFGA